MQAKIQSIRLKNFRAFKKIDLKICSDEDIRKNNPSFCVFVGANGTGKSTIFSVFNFLKKAMETNVTTALGELGHSNGKAIVELEKLSYRKGSYGRPWEFLKFSRGSEEARDLTQFLHPQRAVYVFGPERGDLSARVRERCRVVVKIPTRFCVNVGIAAAVVLYDRVLCLGGGTRTGLGGGRES